MAERHGTKKLIVVIEDNHDSHGATTPPPGRHFDASRQVPFVRLRFFVSRTETCIGRPVRASVKSSLRV